ncbi:MAG TPA: NAD-glutamate dehydrogenase [Thermoanaerobaculia bacterium]|nr:NAD-glutamate dehydrogenase [Thermoanaerobaculia bacterium]
MAAPSAEIRKTELLDGLAALARERSAAGAEAGAPVDPEAAERFVRRSYERIAPDDILVREPEDLVGAALALWRWGRERTPGQAKIRVYNPTREEHGWESPFTAVEVVNDDRPFLVDSVTAALNGLDRPVQLVLHPVVDVRRDASGVRGPGGEAALGEPRAESYMQIEVDRIFAQEGRDEVVATLDRVLRDVRTAVEDWRAMRAKLAEIVRGWETDRPPVSDVEIGEARRFLEWLDANHFTFLGYRELDLVEEGGRDHLKLVPGSSLGVLRAREDEDSYRLRALTDKMSEFARQPQLLFVTKANHRSTVHRPSHMDYIGIKRFDEAGRVVGERRFLGLFTSVAYNRRAQNIPLLREKVERTLERAGLPADSHDGKALVHILETFPRDELFQISEQELFEISLGILQLQERQRIALFVRPDPFERFISCLVYAPRDRYNTELRLKMQAILEDSFAGQVTAHYTQVSDSPLARVHYVVKTTPGRIPDSDLKEIETRLAEAARTWSDQLYEALLAEGDEEVQDRLFRRYREAFPTAFRERFPVEQAVFDLAKIEEVLATGRLGMHLYRPQASGTREVRFKLYHPERPIALSDVLPLLENMGVRVGSEIPYEVRPTGVDRPLWIHDFGLELRDGWGVELEQLVEIFPEAFERAWRGEVENDGFNRLVVRAGLAWHEVVVLRAYARFLRQARATFSQAYLQETLASNPEMARLLVELFELRFDPDARDGAEERMVELQVRIRRSLEAVRSLDEDRILRRFLNLVRHTVRTNHYQRTETGERKSYLSLKLASGGVKVLPKPRPLYEVFVYSPQTEAVHLRGGKVARGGIRWSDRREDFRTEVLGLLKAQMVKNAVIVPVGAKGGFVVKRPPVGGDREAQLQEGIACYRTLIRGLLDLTDNLVDGRVVAPERVVRLDGDDPYLVVAADKGTARFSDLANELAAEYGFWLGDAFAAGGSAGYDHKAMGITARGAWVAVERHFRELGADIRSEDFTVVGVGDMSGDVFGNGMLLSEHIRLIGAFNHLHVFVDPDPDPAVSFAERQRLFGLPRSSWIDYDETKISKGGGVFDRSAKAVELSAEIRELLGLKEESVAPGRLVQALLTARCDLLWFGGIGTFVKASTESNATVGDRANDGVRVDASALRCRVLGEGANLGITHPGRIEFALEGGRINTDAIDNSAGVDTSDHEVNIKILLGGPLSDGRLALADRDRLLSGMTEEVAALVLRDNYLQTQALSVAETRGLAAIDAQQRMMRTLERSGQLDRALEALPDDEELAARQAASEALTRPEIAVLLAYSKIFLYGHLLGSSLVEDPLLTTDLLLYFPKELRERFSEEIERHRLRREIIATFVTNSMVNRVGPSFLTEMMAETGAEPADVARAYTVVREAFDLRSLWAEVEALDYRVPAEAQLRMMVAAGRMVERVTLWLLRNTEAPLDISACTAEFRPAVENLAASLEEVLTRSELQDLRRRERVFLKEGVPPEVARRVASLQDLAAACDVWTIARQTGRPVEEAGRIFFGLGDRFCLAWLREVASRLTADGRWQKAALAAVVDDLFYLQGELTRQVLSAVHGDGSPRQTIEVWAAARRGAVARAEEVIREVRTAKSPDLAMVMVANDQLRRLVVAGDSSS